MLLFRMFNMNGVIDIAIFFYSRMERDADFLHKKAERATLRVCLREKYRLPKVHFIQHYIGCHSKNNSLKNIFSQVSFSAFSHSIDLQFLFLKCKNHLRKTNQQMNIAARYFKGHAAIKGYICLQFHY